jgi:putative sigma-54 modulation protein
MDIIFRGHHVTVPDQFRSYASDHLAKITRYLPSADHAIVDLRREAKGDEGRYVVQVTVSANGRYLRAEERNFDLTVAIDACADVLSRQVQRFKETKLLRSQRRVNKDEIFSAESEEEEPNLPPDVEIIEGRVVRKKQFSMKPMTEAEAIEQMEMLGHNFFLFQDTDKDTLALLYRRNDGDYGMILPEMA